MEQIKPWYTSKTIWFNVISAALIGAETNFSLLKPFLGEAVYGIAYFTLIMGNIFFRTITDKGVKLRAK